MNWCFVCSVEIDYEDVLTNWCSYGNHTLRIELHFDWSLMNRRCVVQ